MTTIVDPQLRFKRLSARKCPHCGSANVRAMTKEETGAFYGSASFVIRRPRTCLSCGHGWEPTPSQFACLVMMGAAALVSVTLIAFCFACVALIFTPPQGAPLMRVVVRSFMAILVCGSLTFVSGSAFRKYWVLWRMLGKQESKSSSA
jgi:hypothetical protein